MPEKRERDNPTSGIEPERISNKVPVKRQFLVQDGKNENQGHVIRSIELRQYVERNDKRLGDYSLLTVVVETDKGVIEIKYDEGFRGADAFESAVTMLTQYVGFASLINRALIELQCMAPENDDNNNA